MDFLLKIDIPELTPKLKHTDNVLLIGSCFTEHVFNFLRRNKFAALQNSHGVLFNPLSVCKALDDLVENKKYTQDDLFFLNEYYHSWFFHADFSCLQANDSLQKMNDAISTQHQFLKEADYIFITLGSSYAYYLLDEKIYVSNNHRAPLNQFRKDLLSIETMTNALTAMQEKLKAFNPKLKFVYTISPVRHSRDGVIENNRSKARLLETVHRLPNNYYFPSYELVIDVLRDYRFYDIDLVHPNYPATAYVWEQFKTHCIEPTCFPIMKKLEQLYKAKNHKPKDTNSQAHQEFLKDHWQLCNALKTTFPYLKLEEEMNYFLS
jgi:hypothetical protein